MALGGALGRLAGARRWAVLTSLVWIVVVLAYGIGFLSVVAGTQSRGTVFLDAMFFLVALVLPLGLVWLVAWLADELTRQREIIAALAEATAPLMEALEETRSSLSQHASPQAMAEAVGAAVGEAVSGVRAPDVSRSLNDLVAGQARLEAALGRLAAISPAAPPAPRALAQRKPSSAAAPLRSDAQEGNAGAPELPLDTAAPDLGWDDLVRALDFPRDADDHEGFRALTAAQKQPKLGQTIQAAEDVLNLLSQEGIFVDELSVQEVDPSVWRRFMSGVRGAKVSAIGGVTDEKAIEVASRLLKSDAVFRDTALFFLRRFERVLAEHARDADDDELAAISGTRSGRAFMLLSRTSGMFG